MKKTITATVKISFTFQDATGPNPTKLPYELLDNTGLRFAYVHSDLGAITEAKEAIDGALIDGGLYYDGLPEFEVTDND